MPTFEQFCNEHDQYANSEYFADELEHDEVVNANNSAYNLVKSYFDKANKNGKLAMHNLGADLADAYAKYLAEEFVEEEAFKNDDVKQKYATAVRDKVAEGLKEKLTTFFETAGQTADEIRLTLPIK